jgi:diguanylate cyclase (GGDEF)-like protein
MPELPDKPAGWKQNKEVPEGRPKLKLISVDDVPADQAAEPSETPRNRRGDRSAQPALRAEADQMPSTSPRFERRDEVVDETIAVKRPVASDTRGRRAAGQNRGVGSADSDSNARYLKLSEEKQALELAKAQIAQWAQMLEERVAERTVELARRNSQLTMLNTLAKAINQSLDPTRMSQSVLELICELFGAEMGVVWISPPGQTLSVEARIGLPESSNREMQRGWPSRELLQGQMQAKFSAVVSDTTKDITPEGRMARHLGMGSAAVVPIKARTEVIGLMVIGSEEPDVLDSEDATVLDVFSEQFGVGITNALLYADARQRAERDPVTGLFNHRTLQQKLIQSMAKADDERGSLAVVLMDLDNFKFFNDTYGHLNGDDVLRLVGMAIEQSIEGASVCGRYGGDEFMLLLPGADHRSAAAIVQKVRKTLSEAGYRPAGQPQNVPLAMSYGVAVYPSDGLSRHELIVQADANLFRSKTGGGDVVNAPSPYIVRARQIPGYEMLDSLIATVDNKDRYTRRHSEDVAEYAYILGEAMGLDQDMLDTLAVAGLLHDVGKIGVPDSILRKPGKLTQDELLAIQSHPTFGALIVGAIPSLQHILPAVRHHHERWDGRGYPDGLIGEETPLIARIMAVADAVSAMTTDRPYRNGMEWSVVLDNIEKGLGTQFDPEIGRVFVDHMRQVQFSPASDLMGLSEAA